MLAPVASEELKTHKKPVRCRHCGVSGFAIHRSPDTGHEWKKWPAILRADGLYVADLSQPMHVCAFKPQGPEVVTLAATPADPEASAWDAVKAPTAPVRPATVPPASDDVATLVRALGALVRILEQKLNAGEL